MGGKQAHRRAADTSLGQRIGGDLLGLELGEEIGHPTPSAEAFFDPLGRGEQREHRVEIGVSTSTRVAAAQ